MTPTICRFCYQDFKIISKLNAHLDKFIRKSCPVPPDGIHDIHQILVIRSDSPQSAAKKESYYTLKDQPPRLPATYSTAWHKSLNDLSFPQTCLCQMGSKALHRKKLPGLKEFQFLKDQLELGFTAKPTALLSTTKPVAPFFTTKSVTSFSTTESVAPLSIAEPVAPLSTTESVASLSTAEPVAPLSTTESLVSFSTTTDTGCSHLVDQLKESYQIWDSLSSTDQNEIWLYTWQQALISEEDAHLKTAAELKLAEQALIREKDAHHKTAAKLKLVEQEIQCLYKQLGRSDKVTHPEMLEELGKIDENRSLEEYF